MSTVAYKDGVLAADARVSNDVVVLANDFVKVRNIGGVLVGVSGDPSLMSKYAKSIEDGEPIVIDSGELIIVTEADGVWTVDEYGTYPCLQQDQVAIGTGYIIAETAMACGKSAVEAVELAKTIDIYSGGKTHSVSFDALPS